MGLKDMFGLSGASTPKDTTKQTNETYEEWGTRVCGQVVGSLFALPAFLQKVYNSIYNEQAQNKALQDLLITNKKGEIVQKEGEIESLQREKDEAKKRIADIKESIAEKTKEKCSIEGAKNKVNYEYLPTFIIGLVILVLLTCYLFIFYSSTFYSAFFRNPQQMTGVANAMFDANALSNAANNGLTEILFVLLAPIIFLGLGFILHVFSEHKMKVQAAGILLVTVMFDCILAFKIGDQLHTFNMMIGNVPIGTPYGMKEALGDINTWAVIFCGFIAYVIWGIVFDAVMTAFGKMDFNRTRIKEINADVKERNAEIATIQTNLAEIEKNINKIKLAIKVLEVEITHSVNIDYELIKTEMNNFYAGWIKMTVLLSRPADEMEKAEEIFNNMIKSIEKTQKEGREEIMKSIKQESN